jgi:hypothetical protein
MHGLKALKNKKGSSIIMVLLAMAFISILGTILLLMASTGYQIKAAQARGERAFYSAETALDEVRAGVQHIVSESIAAAYTLMLQEYRHDDSAGDLEDIFRKHFRAQLVAHGSALLSPLDMGFVYNGGVLWDFVSDDERTSGNIAGEDFKGIVEAPGDVFILKDIIISHRSEDGFVSTISSDIAIAVPDFSYVRAAYTISGVPEFALIAKEELRIPAVSPTITGSAYAGEINVNTGESDTFRVQNGTLISSGDINVGGIDINSVSTSGRLITDNSDLWANRIIIGEHKSMADLNGDTFVADDLVLQGEGATAILAGRYYGFGSSLEFAWQSSAIIVNGIGSMLGLDGLSQLFLAGRSFIDTRTYGYDPENPTNVYMGQSISVKSDQLAYLIPAEDIAPRHMNPIIYDGVGTPVYTIDAGEYPNYHKVFRPIGGSTLVFFFRAFDSGEAANDYFESYQEDIEKYVENYISLGDFGSPANVQTSGFHYAVDSNGGGYTLTAGAPVPAAELNANAVRLGTMFGNITVTLSSNIRPPSGIANPYEYIVNEAAVDGLSNGEYEFLDGDVVRAVIIKCNGNSITNTSSLPSGVNLILSTGNVVVNNVSGEFEGLIISNGYIELYNDVNAAHSALIPSMSARNTSHDLGVFSGFLNLSVTDDSFDSSGDASLWAMNELVYFENWHRK